MLIKKVKDKRYLLDQQKIVAVKNPNFLNDLDDTELIEVNPNVPNFIEVTDVKNTKEGVSRDRYTFLEKKEIIEKFEINFGSLLIHEDITNIKRKQFPMFNMLTKGDNLLIAGHDLQDIYIDYFVRLMSNINFCDVIVDDAIVLDGYTKIDSVNGNDNQIITSGDSIFAVKNGMVKPFSKVKDAGDFLECINNLQRESILGEWVEKGQPVSIKEITLFGKYKVFGIVKA